MTHEDERPVGDLTVRMAEIVNDALRELRADADLSADQEHAIAAALVNAVKRAVQLGASEVAAQAIEKGVDLNLHMFGDLVTLDDLEP